jgi:ATP adenylyltransferase
LPNIDSERQEGCPFCNMLSSRIIAVNALSYAVRDLYPDTVLHTLIIPKRHVADYFDLRQPERRAIHRLMEAERERVRSIDKTVSAFNIAINCGKDAGQTVLHCHIHLVPRRHGDDAELDRALPGVVSNKHAVGGSP